MVKRRLHHHRRNQSCTRVCARTSKPGASLPGGLLAALARMRIAAFVMCTSGFDSFFRAPPKLEGRSRLATLSRHCCMVKMN